jgi:fructose-bisphosphate aldolase class II/tagatose 1,6-diphosphate aldolase GatY/KbaY
MMKIGEKLYELKKEGKAVLATNFYNIETLKGILRAAEEVSKPVILQLSESSIDYMGLEASVKIARQGLSDHNVEGWLHLDHGSSTTIVRKCLDAGFDSVMIDSSEKDFETNIRITSEVVRLAESYGAGVEAELGYVPKLGQDQGDRKFTCPDEARIFAEQTGIDALAVAIGSVHGFYRDKPDLRTDILAMIRAAVPVPLVLHGSSGIPDAMLQDAVRNGICKVNLATEIKDIFMKTLKDCMAKSDEIDLRKVFPFAIDAIAGLVKNKLMIIDSV